MEDPLRLSPVAWVGGEWTTAAPAAPSTTTELQLVTWNAWFGGHMFEERAVALLAELERRSPHVIALQEVTPLLVAALADAEWVRRRYQLSHLDVVDYDVLLLSREPIRRLTSLDLPTEMGRRLLVAELSCGLRVARPGDPLEEAALDATFRDVWPSLHPSSSGFTVDTDRNPMRLASRSTPTRKRIDRIFLRSERWRATAIELLGTQAIDVDETFVSDHFGLAASVVAGGRV